MVVESTAEQSIKATAGRFAIITVTILFKRIPPYNDLADIIRKMPGLIFCRQ